jgi:hypothetical protein
MPVVTIRRTQLSPSSSSPFPGRVRFVPPTAPSGSHPTHVLRHDADHARLLWLLPPMCVGDHGDSFYCVASNAVASVSSTPATHVSSRCPPRGPSPRGVGQRRFPSPLHGHPRLRAQVLWTLSRDIGFNITEYKKRGCGAPLSPGIGHLRVAAPGGLRSWSRLGNGLPQVTIQVQVGEFCSGAGGG